MTAVTLLPVPLVTLTSALICVFFPAQQLIQDLSAATNVRPASRFRVTQALSLDSSTVQVDVLLLPDFDNPKQLPDGTVLYCSFSISPRSALSVMQAFPKRI